MGGVGEQPVDHIPCAQLHVAGGGAVGAAVPFAVRQRPVEDHAHLPGRSQKRTEHRGGADHCAHEPLQLLRRGEGYPGHAQRGAEILRAKGLVARGDEEVKGGLLTVAQKQGLDGLHLQTVVDGLTILHGDGGVVFHPLKGNGEPGQGTVDQLLQGRGKMLRHGGHGLADMNHEKNLPGHTPEAL